MLAFYKPKFKTLCCFFSTRTPKINKKPTSTRVAFHQTQMQVGISTFTSKLLCNQTTSLRKKDCTVYYVDKQFSILAKGRLHFYLSTLEATCIKTFKPELCCQKEFVCTLKLPHPISDFSKRSYLLYQSRHILYHPIRNCFVQHKFFVTLLGCHSSKNS